MRFWVKSAVPNVGRSLPVYLQLRTCRCIAPTDAKGQYRKSQFVPCIEGIPSATISTTLLPYEPEARQHNANRGHNDCGARTERGHANQ
jgi:hypothetical protein